MSSVFENTLSIDASGNVADLEVDSGTFSIDADNNRVGIGTTTPSSTLEIEGSSGDLTIEIDNNVSNSANLKIVSGAGNARADFIVDGNNHLTMKGQRVGIVTTNPQKTLDVTGDGQFSTDLTVGGNIRAADGGCVFGTVEFNSTVADESVSGIVATFTAGEAVVRGDVVYSKDDSKMYKVNMTASNAAAIPAVAMAAADISLNASGTFLLQGFIHDAGTFATFTVAARLYAPEATGGPTATAPSTTGDTVQVLGWATTADSIYFNPSNDIVVVA